MDNVWLYWHVATAINQNLDCLATTVPGPPTHLQVVNVTDTRAVLQWTPSLGKVDRFIISYESSKSECGSIKLTSDDKAPMTVPNVIDSPSCHSS